jgi:chromosome segregation ATPase
MRGSTIVFLCIFGALFARANNWSPCKIRLHCDRSNSTTCSPAQKQDSQKSSLTRAIEERIRVTERHFRETDEAVRKLEKTVRSLQDLARQAEKDLARSPNSFPEARRLRQQTLHGLTEELGQISRGHHELLALRARLQGEHTALQARLQLAKAGLLKVEQGQGKQDEAGERPTPLEALQGESDFWSAY